MQTAIPCTLMRGGTSKGPFFRAEDLPQDVETRASVLLSVMGSPDFRQIDGLGGANPLTSKVAMIGPPTREDTDVDYLFLQVFVDKALVDTSQNCGNMLAGVGPFAIEHGMVQAGDPETRVRIHMVNSGSVAVATVQTPGGKVNYQGNARIDGVPGTAAPVLLDFLDIAGSACGSLLPTGNTRDTFGGLTVTCIDNGMPVIVVRAADLGVTGYEDPKALEANQELRAKVEALRLEAARAMGLGDVTSKTIPKISLIAEPKNETSTLTTRTFIPHRVHEAIGVLGAVSVATACLLPGSITDGIARVPPGATVQTIEVEHPTGSFTVQVEVAPGGGEVKRAALLRTARKLMAGETYIPREVWAGRAA